MSDIVKVTEEEFDEEGNLVRRVITEYTQPPFKFNTGGVVKTGTAELTPNTGIHLSPPGDYILMNGPSADAVVKSWLDAYNHGSFHSHRQGGTDRDVNGVVVS